MGFETTFHMLIGAIIGWGFLSPLAKQNGWAPGDVNDWKDGSRGWIVWVSLAIMLADSIFSLGSLAYDNIRDYYLRYTEGKRHHENIVEAAGYNAPLLIDNTRPNITRNQSSRGERSDSDPDAGLFQIAPRRPKDPRKNPIDQNQAVSSSIAGNTLRHRGPNKLELDDDFEDVPYDEDDTPPEHLVSKPVVYYGLFGSAVLCIGAIAIVFPQTPVIASVIAFLLALVMSLMGVRALGENSQVNRPFSFF